MTGPTGRLCPQSTNKVLWTILLLGLCVNLATAIVSVSRNFLAPEVHFSHLVDLRPPTSNEILHHLQHLF